MRHTHLKRVWAMVWRERVTGTGLRMMMMQSAAFRFSASSPVDRAWDEG